MMKKIALCAVLALLLVPAFAMAAGPQESGAGAAQSRHAMQGMEQGQSIGAGKMMQNGTCSQNCETARLMIRNQSHLGTESAGGLSAQSIDAAQQHQRLGTRTMDKIMNRTHLRDGSCGNCTRL